ncbi:MAG: lipocalin family protein [Bacteroidia bacterium]
MRSVRILALTWGLLFLWRCKPDDKGTPPVDAFVSSLTGSGSKTWRMQNLAVSGSSQPLPNCRQDDRWVFRSDNTCSYQNATMCGSGDTPPFSGSWRAANSNRYIIVEASGGVTYSHEVIQLSENLLVWEYVGSGGELIQETWVP